MCEESEDCADDEICDTYVIEQTDKGFRCAIDVPSVLYKYVTLSPYIVMRHSSWFWIRFLCWLVWSTGTLLVKKGRHAGVWNLTQRHPSTSQNKELKDRLVRLITTEDFWNCLCKCVHWVSPPLTVITGFHKGAVSSAVTRVEVLVESFRKKQPFTHFLSFPLNHPKVQEGFLKFKEEVLQQCSKVQ